MNESWKRLDLAGGGVQALNLLLARQLKKRRTAYSLLALLPLGLHRFYLASPVAGALYILASLAAAALTWWGLGPAAAVVALAVVVAGGRGIRRGGDRGAAPRPTMA
jgi:TM2 domain-containing membrane protein YozV